MKSKFKILAIALSAAMMLPTAFAYASEDATREKSISESSEIMPLVGNVEDYNYGFKFASNGATQGTVGRAKEDKSKCYIRIDTKTVDSCRVYIDGSKKPSGSRWVNETSHKNTTKAGGYCVASIKGQFSIQNRVRQNGYYYARLTGWANSLKGKLAGVWSPDSTKSYTILNHA